MLENVGFLLGESAPPIRMNRTSICCLFERFLQLRMLAKPAADRRLRVVLLPTFSNILLYSQKKNPPRTRVCARARGTVKRAPVLGRF
jgi:hypothetical protein